MSIARSNQAARRAEQRRCPRCGRKSALKTITNPGQVVTYCRWADCDYENEAMYAAGDRHSAANGVHPATVKAALRSLITPPRPPEPTGLGAVVEDEDGATYIRRATDWTDVPWVRADKPGFYGWAEITAVTVLSEGVQ